MEINGEDITRCGQSEVVKMLKSVYIGESVFLKLSRVVKIQESLDDSVLEQFKGPTSTFSYHVPLNDSASAGLGLQLKGPASEYNEISEGLFIEKILHGGAASKVSHNIFAMAAVSL